MTAPRFQPKFVHRGYKNEDFFSLLTTIIYPKIKMNVVMVILPWQ